MGRGLINKASKVNNLINEAVIVKEVKPK